MKNKIKICLFTSYFSVFQGGSEYHTYLIANSLDPQKYDIFFMTVGEDKEGVCIIDGYRIYSIKLNKILRKLGRHYFFYYPKIKKILSNEKPEIVYRRSASSIPGLLSYLSKKLNFRFIWACANEPDLSKFKLSGFRNILTNFDDLLRIYGILNANTILVQSNDQKQMLKENFGRECYIVPNFHPQPVNPIIKKEAPIKVVWIANIKKQKQPEIFIALAKKFQNWPKVKFTMIGRPAEGQWQKNLEKRIKELNNLNYLGEQSIEEVNKILCKSHIFVNTSKYEGFPNSFIQAWMRKVPVVTLVVDPDGIIKKENIGIHSGNFEQMVKNIKRIIEDDDMRNEMAERAKIFAERHFGMKNIEKIVSLFEE